MNKDKKLFNYICKFCSNSFTRTKKQSYNKNNYCSIQCDRNSRKKGVYKNCLNCNKNIYVPLSRLKISDIHFCTISCANKYKHENGLFGIHSACNFKNIDWDKCQQLYDNNMSLNDLQKYGATPVYIEKAIKLGLFIKDDNRKYITSEETKQKLSSALKLAHATGKHSGWSHINSRNDKTSYPERFFIEVLKNNGLYDKYNIEQKLSIGKYFLDFAIIDLKLNIEIDGQQHFRTDDAILHDKIRNEYLINKGWKIYRICWIEMMQKTQEIIEHFINYINNIDNETNHYYVISDIVLKRQPKYGTREDYNKILKENKEKYNIEQQKYIDLVLNSDIDFSKFGWVNKVALIINQRPQKVNIWMKRFMSEFYYTKCFKRK